MCLRIAFTVHRLNRSQVATIEQSPSAEDELWVWYRAGTRRGQGPHEFTISTDPRSCACSLLTDDADWNVPSWDMDPDARGRLARTVERLLKAIPGEVVFEARWEGDDVKEHMSISRAGLLNLIRAGGLGTSTRYLVLSAGSAAPKPSNST